MLISTPNHTSVPQPHPLRLLPFVPPPSLAFVPSAGSPSGRSHHQLSAGEVACGPPEPRGEKLPHFLPVDRRGRGRPSQTHGPGEEPAAVPVPDQSKNVVPELVFVVQLI